MRSESGNEKKAFPDTAVARDGEQCLTDINHSTYLNHSDHGMFTLPLILATLNLNYGRR